MNTIRAVKVAQAIIFTVPWTATIAVEALTPATFSEAFASVAIVWAIISPFVLAGTSMVSYRCGLIRKKFGQPNLERSS